MECCCRSSNWPAQQCANTAIWWTDHSIFLPAPRQTTWAHSPRKHSLPCSSHKETSLGEKSELWIFQQHPTKRGSQAWSSFPKHITVTRKNAQKASPAKLAAILNHRAEVTAKSFPGAGTILATWAGDLRTRSQSPSQGVSRPLPSEEQDGDSLQVISLVCGHRPPLYSTSNFTH